MGSPIMLQETAYYALYSKFAEKMIDNRVRRKMLLAFVVYCSIIAAFNNHLMYLLGKLQLKHSIRKYEAFNKENALPAAKQE